MRTRIRLAKDADDCDEDEDEDLYIIGAVCLSVCPSVTKVIISATVAGEIYI